MAIYQKEGSPYWWYSFTPPGGKRVRESTGTRDRQEAQQLFDKLKADSWKQNKLGIKPRYTWQEVVVKHLKEAKTDDKPSIEHDITACRWLDPYLRDKYLDEIDQDLANFIRDEKRKPYTKIYATGQERHITPSAETVNRFLTVFRAMLYKARDEWKWIDIVPKIKAVPVKAKKVEFLTRDQADYFIAFLPPHLAAMSEFVLQTGLRRHNATHLKWNQVDIKRRTAWVHCDETKNAKALAVPLNDVAIAILLKQKGLDLEWVFPYHGEPVHQVCTKAWRDACSKAGIKFTFHGLRHTWASWHVQNGTPLQVLMELGGWSSLKMVLRYAHFNSEHLQKWADRPALRVVVDNERRSA
jgi:integrase